MKIADALTRLGAKAIDERESVAARPIRHTPVPSSRRGIGEPDRCRVELLDQGEGALSGRLRAATRGHHPCGHDRRSRRNCEDRSTPHSALLLPEETETVQQSHGT